MSEFASHGKLPHVPDDITIAEFILDQNHDFRPARPQGTPWFVVEKTGKKIGADEKRTRGLEAGMRNRFGIGEDDVVLLFSSNHIDYPICIWAAHRLLAAISPCNPSFTASELVHQLRQTKPSIIIAHADVLDVALQGARAFGLPLERIIVLTNNDGVYSNRLTVNDLVADGLSVPYSSLTRKLNLGEGRKKVAFLSPSSGTTGPPKVLALSHYADIANVLMISSHNEHRYRPGDVCLGILPFYHIYGIIIILHVPVFCAMTVVVVPKFAFKEMLASIMKYKINQLSIVPPQVVMLLKDPVVPQYDLSTVRVIICAGAALSASLTTELVKLFPRAQVGQTYGQTESGGGIAMLSGSKQTGFSCGNLLPGIVARAVKSDGSLANRGEAGERYVRTPAMAAGYWGNETATRETWIRTGDLVMFNTDEEVIYIDRLKEIIKVNGFQVAPAELEGCLLNHSMVTEVCVVGIPHERTGEVPLAFVVLTSDAARTLLQGDKSAEIIKEELMQHVAENKTRYKHLGHVEFVDAIPKNPSGKILRRMLREKAQQLVGSEAKL
ncbi:amp dependent CoA ligase [Mycena epipterygia]|nr:amp dependent CoA ligase [Mycena epipterygia]